MTVLSREVVHQHSEACSEMGEAFQSIAMRLTKEQKRLLKYLEEQFQKFDPLAGQIAMYMATVCVRVFEETGTRLRKVNSEDIRAAEKYVGAYVSKLLPADDGFSERAKELERAQPHLMDEILWALYDRDEEEKLQDEAILNPKQSAQIYILLWVAVEALNAKWVG